MGNGYIFKKQRKMMMLRKNLGMPDLGGLSMMSRSMLVMIMFLFALPSISSKNSGSSHINNNDKSNNLVYLVEEGIVKKGDQGLIVLSSEVNEVNLVMKGSNLLSHNGIGIRFLDESHVMEGVNVNIPNEALDFVFVQSLNNVEAIDRMMKPGGVVISQLGKNVQKLQPPANYVIVLLSPLEHTMVVLRKTGHKPSPAIKAGRRSLFGIGPETKKAALLGLEDAMLEPPTEELAKSKKLSRKMKFLPDLMKDSLEKYPRRIFVSDGDKSATKWFKENYPSRGQKFEFYDVEIVANEGGNNERSAGLLSDWLRNHVKEEDYVVMKAEAALVEEMIKEKTTTLVDELFLECKNHWGEEEEESSGSEKRSYWQCLALYGRLRDEGVAVHQWWS